MLMVEAFSSKLIDKRTSAYTAIGWTALILLATFYVAPQSATLLRAASGVFIPPIATRIFFKRIALATTCGRARHDARFRAARAGMGFTAPHHNPASANFLRCRLFTCVGLMWMASAIDFVLIFVSLELVTMSFYVLVGFTRRNPATLEAGSEIFGPQRACDRISGLRNHLDFRS